MPSLKNPTCANCGGAMKQRPSHDNKTVLTVFECTRCGVVFYTEDHVPITGLPTRAATQEDTGWPPRTATPKDIETALVIDDFRPTYP